MSLIKKELPIQTLVKMQETFSRIYSSTELVAVNSDAIHVTASGMFELLRRTNQTPVIFPFSRTEKEVKVKISGVCFYALISTKVLKERELL